MVYLFLLVGLSNELYNYDRWATKSIYFVRAFPEGRLGDLGLFLYQKRLYTLHA